MRQVPDVRQVETLVAGVVSGRPLTAAEARPLLDLGGGDTASRALLAGACAVRERFRGRRVFFCAIVNAKAGHCGEDCSYCAQSRVSEVIDYARHPWLEDQAIQSAARAAERDGAAALGLVAAWRGLGQGPRLDMVCRSLRVLAAQGIRADASLGLLDGPETAVRLKEAGLAVYHHNLETARSFFPATRSTHGFSDRWRTCQAARGAGLGLCSGGLFGLGESPDQRIEFMEQLRDLAPDSVPVNFLIPVPGTRVAGLPLLRPDEALIILAVLRLMLPDRRIIMAGGKEEVLGARVREVLAAGVDGVMVGDYLTRQGTPAEIWRRHVGEAGLECG